MTTLYSRNTKVETAPMTGETVLFNPDNNKFCVLNATASIIWQILDQPRTVDEVAIKLTEHFSNVDYVKAEQDTLRALIELDKIGCVKCGN